jgi:hypothetical protein
MILILIILFFTRVWAGDPPAEISLFGSKPIQLSVGKDGIKQNKTPGYVCEVTATLGGGHYSEWGETEKDARTIVMKKCSDESGMLLCKEDRVTCKIDN